MISELKRPQRGDEDEVYEVRRQLPTAGVAGRHVDCSVSKCPGQGSLIHPAGDGRGSRRFANGTLRIPRHAMVDKG